jgi:hypothetical protein
MKGAFVSMEATVKKVGNLSVKIITDDNLKNRNNIISDSDAEMDNRATAAVRAAIDKAKVCGKPIARYDSTNKRAYIEYANGEKKYVN